MQSNNNNNNNNNSNTSGVSHKGKRFGEVKPPSSEEMVAEMHAHLGNADVVRGFHTAVNNIHLCLKQEKPRKKHVKEALEYVVALTVGGNFITPCNDMEKQAVEVQKKGAQRALFTFFVAPAIPSLDALVDVQNFVLEIKKQKEAKLQGEAKLQELQVVEIGAYRALWSSMLRILNVNTNSGVKYVPLANPQFDSMTERFGEVLRESPYNYFTRNAHLRGNNVVFLCVQPVITMTVLETFHAVEQCHPAFIIYVGEEEDRLPPFIPANKRKPGDPEMTRSPLYETLMANYTLIGSTIIPRWANAVDYVHFYQVADATGLNWKDVTKIQDEHIDMDVDVTVTSSHDVTSSRDESVTESQVRQDPPSKETDFISKLISDACLSDSAIDEPRSIGELIDAHNKEKEKEKAKEK
jgi:hypothetical protein